MGEWVGDRVHGFLREQIRVEISEGFTPSFAPSRTLPDRVHAPSKPAAVMLRGVCCTRERELPTWVVSATPFACNCRGSDECLSAIVERKRADMESLPVRGRALAGARASFMGVLCRAFPVCRG